MNKKLLIVFAFLSVLSKLDVSAQSKDYDVKMGEAAAVAVIEKYGIYNNSELKTYVDEIGYSLVDQLSEDLFEFRFIILDDPTPNAFALLGGYVFITRGLLALVNNADELAGVIGHEIVHVQKRHGVKQMRHSILPTVLQVPFQIAGGILGGSLGQMVEAPASIGASMFNSSYSRRHETESDKLGIVLAARSGFDPSALSGILERIIDWEESLSDFEESRSYFSSHPYTPDRVENISAVSKQLEWSPSELHKTSAVNHLHDLLFWNNPKKGIFVENVFLHPTMDFSVSYPEKWSYSNKTSSVGATNKDQTASILLGINTINQSPKSLAKAFMRDLKEYNRKLEVVNKPLLIGDSTAHMVKVTESVNKDQMTLMMVWIAHGSLIYNFTAISHKDIEEEVLITANSLHPLTEKEKDEILEYRLKVVQAKEGETFEMLSRRTGNMLGESMWKTLNGRKENEDFTGGEKIKIIVESPYF
ncbi:MAG: M48 family metalloprotease [Reichenbachiella sp.]